MLNPYFSDFINSLKNGINKIKNYHNFDKIAIIFWLAGPFIYLIERSPADIWLTSFALVFLFRSFKLKDWEWAKQTWFIFALLLWLLGLISSLQGPMPSFSLGQGFVWIRFPLYAAAAQIWLGRDRDIRLLMLTLMTVSLLIMSFILFSEVLIDPKNRLMWPYGDVIPGSFIAKACLPVFCILITLVFHTNYKASILIIAILFIGLLALKFTGERSNLILVVCSLITSTIFVKLSFKRTLVVGILTLIIGYVSINTFSSLTKRCLDQKVNCLEVKEQHVNIFDQIPIKNFNTSYWGAWRGGIQQGLENPILGVGPSGSRHTCGLLKDHWLPGKNFCGNHPHNFYVQLFAETGFIGLGFGTLMFFFIMKLCYKARKQYFSCKMASTAFVIPFGIFFPFQHFGSFYGQWGNLFIWFAIGFALSQTGNILKKYSYMSPKKIND